jgi:hypothetical protein
MTDHKSRRPTVKFRLLYEGELAPRQHVSAGDLHSIRMQLHPQIKALWQYRPLSDCGGWLREKPERPGDYAIWERSSDVLLSPLISHKNHLMCELDITLLRQQEPGQLLGEGGGIDSRLKTLFDALRKPSTEEAQTAAIAKRADDDPIHCLLQDDALVTRVNVETDRLLRPTEGQFDLVAIIQVTVVLTRVSFGTINLLSRSQ